jgi:hypothetical protein
MISNFNIDACKLKDYIKSVYVTYMNHMVKKNI